MAKKILGVDMGHDSLKLVLRKGKQIIKTVSVQMPENLLRDGQVASVETMGELIRSTMKKEGIRCSSAAWAIGNENCFVRTVKMPKMTADQLVYNLPFEFRDYITGELRDYTYDYGMISISEEDDEMELLAVAVPSKLLENARMIFRKAGLRLVKAAPTVCSYLDLIRSNEEKNEKEYCILDLGYRAIRMYMYRGDRHIASRVLETGLFRLDEAVADAYHIDVHLAHTYLLKNYDDCQNQAVCREVFDQIAVELMRALNFYRFSNPESSLSDLWICGGGAQIASLESALKNVLDMKLHEAHELIPDMQKVENCGAFIQAIGIARQMD